jgi:hypothetical protein
VERISPAFLRQFPPGVKSLNGKLMDIIFWPTQSSHGIQGDANLDAEEGMMSLGEKRRVVGHLIELVRFTFLPPSPSVSSLPRYSPVCHTYSSIARTDQFGLFHRLPILQ